MKRKKLFITLGVSFIVLLGIFLILNLFGLLSLLGVSNTLDYKTSWSNQDLTRGYYQTEATLKVPDKSNEISFTPNYNFETYKIDSTDVKINVKYEVYNYLSNSFNIIHQKSWDLKNNYGEQNKFRMDGENVYSNGIPEKLEVIQIGRTEYDRYYGCLEGKSIEEALILNPWAEGTSTYHYKCLYPDNSLIKHEYGDDSDENWDIELFPKLIVLDSNYMNNSEILFRISVNVLSSGIDKINYNDFQIDIWDVKTELVTYNRFSDNECNEIKLMNYQKTVNDFEKLFDCQEKIILNKWILTEGVCSLEKVKFTEIDSNVFDTLEECYASIKPPSPTLSPIAQFFVNIWNWIRELF